MGQRHNRRRTRIRSRNRTFSPIPPSPSSTASSCDLAIPEPIDCLGQCCGDKSAACDSREPMPTYPAPTWHLGYVAWQERERRLQLEEERYRLFGGEPGDDVSLCYRMLEYFGGLDYIDPTPKLPG